jgi:hypothetical protein
VWLSERVLASETAGLPVWHCETDVRAVGLPSLGGFSLLRVQRLAALVRLIRREEGNLHG